MSRQRAVQNLRNLVGQYEPAYPRFRGWLKAVGGSVYVADRPGYVYVQRRDVGGSVQTEQIRMVNGNVPDIDGFPIVVGRNSVSREADIVLGRDQEILLDWLYDYILQSHHEQHEAPDGFDIVSVQERAIIPIRVSPQLTADLTVRVFAGVYPTLEGNAYFSAVASYDLTANVPANGQRWVLLGINQNTGSLSAVNGAIVNIGTTLAVSDLPDIPCDLVTLAAIQLYRLQTSIVEDNIWDFRAITGWAGSPDVYEDGVLRVDCASSLDFTGDWVDVVQDGHRAIIHIPASGATITADAVILPHLSGSTYDDVEDWFIHTQSAGRITGGTVTDNGDGTIDVAAGTGFIKSADDHIGTTYYFDWPSVAGLAPGDERKSWVYVDYNGGTPTVAVTDTQADIDRNTTFTIAELWRDGNDLHIMEKGQNAYNVSMRTKRNLTEVFGFQRGGSGLVTSESGPADRSVAVTEGMMYRGLNEISQAAIDTDPGGANDSFVAFYRDGIGGWTKVAAQHAISNTQYDDGSGALQNLNPNRYGVFWVYLDFDNHLYIQYGQGDYKLAQAEAASVPATMTFLTEFAMLIARVIVEQGAATFYSASFPWAPNGFTSVDIADHGNLAGLSDDDHTQYLLVDGTRAMGGNLDMGNNDIITVGDVDGVDVSDHSARHDVGGADALTTTDGQVASEIVATDANKGIRPARLGINEVVPDQDGVIALGEAGADPTGGGAGTARTYFKDVAGQTKQFFMDDAGNAYELNGILEDVTVTVGVAGDFASPQAAIDWMKGFLIKGNCLIEEIDEADYDEEVEFSGLSIAPGASLTLQGDARVLPGISYVDGAACNQAALANGGSGTCGLANAGNNITVTGTVANPDFAVAGIVNGDRILTYDNAGAIAVHTVQGVAANVITLTVAAPAVGNDGTAICLLPNRSVTRTVAGQAVLIDGTKGVCLIGWLLKPFTGADCSGLEVRGRGSVEAHNIVTQAEDSSIRVLTACNLDICYGASSVWGHETYGSGIGVYGLSGTAVINCQYVVAVDTTWGFGAQKISYVFCRNCIAANCTGYGFACLGGAYMDAVYCTQRQCGTGYYADNNAFSDARSTNANNSVPGVGNYSPAPAGIPGYGNGNGDATINVS